MSKQLLTEFYALCKDGVCLDLLSEGEKRQVVQEGAMFLSGCIQKADTKNGNGRSYPEKVLKREIENYKKVVGVGAFTGYGINRTVFDDVGSETDTSEINQNSIAVFAETSLAAV